jgi:hypothetical protein
MKPPPPIPTGSTELAAWCRWAQAKLISMEVKFSSGTKVRRTTRGIIVEPVRLPQPK